MRGCNPCLQWLDLLNSMLKEAEWARDMHVPTMDEYMTNGYVSFALGPIVLPALYFLGTKLSEKAVQHPEYQSLFKKMSTIGRLLNDFQGFEVDFNISNGLLMPLIVVVVIYRIFLTFVVAARIKCW